MRKPATRPDYGRQPAPLRIHSPDSATVQLSPSGRAARLDVAAVVWSGRGRCDDRDQDLHPVGGDIERAVGSQNVHEHRISPDSRNDRTDTGSLAELRGHAQDLTQRFPRPRIEPHPEPNRRQEAEASRVPMSRQKPPGGGLWEKGRITGRFAPTTGRPPGLGRRRPQFGGVIHSSRVGRFAPAAWGDSLHFRRPRPAPARSRPTSIPASGR